MIELNKNKKADSKLLSIWWFAVLTVIAGGVIIAVLIFQSAKIDVRIAEADILSAKLADCVLANGYFSSEFVSGKMDIFSACGLNEDMLAEHGNYFIKLRLDEAVTKKAIFPEQKYGNNALEGDCKIQQKVFSARNYARCSEVSASGLGFDGKKMTLSIFTASNKEFRLEETK